MAVNLKSLAKDTAIYGLSSIIGRFLNYLLVPLYTHKLAAAGGGYGTITNIYAYTALVLVILTFGMETTFFRFANKEGNNGEHVFGTALTYVSALSAVFLAVVLGGLAPISQVMGYGEHPEFIAFMAITVALDAFQAIPFAYLRYKRKAMKFAALKLAFIVLNIMLNIVAFTCFTPYEGNAFLINLICTSLITFAFYAELRAVKWNLDGKLLRRMLAYSWPMVLLGIAGILNQTADKIIFPFVYHAADAKEQLGIYGAVVKIAMIMAMITQASRNAYVPYSHFAVGAALECRDGTVYTGCNVENAALGSTICAERTAACKAISEGRRDFVRIAVYGDGEHYCYPCGACRQFLAEFAPDMEVLSAMGGGRYVSNRLSELMPYTFNY